jgi:cyclin D2
MTTLLCVEKMELCRAERDKVIFADQRVMNNLLEAERLSMITIDYFVEVQKDITSVMRRIVVNWMMKVCEDVHCENQVFPLAVRLIDQFLARCNTSRQHLQLLGAVCLQVASKLRQAQPVSTETMVYYTDNSITADEMMRVELLILQILDWNISFVTAADFLEHILSRVPWAEENPLLRPRAHLLVKLCCTEAEITRMRPAAVASTCLMAAARGLRIPSASKVGNHVCCLTHVNEKDAIVFEKYVETLLSKEEASVQTRSTS